VVVIAAGYVAGLFLLAYLVCKASDAWTDWRHRVSPEEAARQRAEYVRRLRTPRWRDLEEHFAAPPPAELVSLYSTDLVLLEDVGFRCPSADDPENEEYVAHFTPADLKGIEEASWVVANRGFPFAADMMGNYYTVSFQDGSPVRFHMHDGGESWDVAPSLREFLNGRKVA
jgi:hypothetical protein